MAKCRASDHTPALTLTHVAGTTERMTYAYALNARQETNKDSDFLYDSIV